MSVISGLGGLTGARTQVKGRTASGFRVPDGETASRAEAPLAMAGVFMPSLLAMQEMESGAAQDRDARRNSDSLLEALTALQRALLGNGSSGELEALAHLAKSMPAAADPRLAAVQRALLVRVAVELARRRVEVSS